ncbi:hypothetical protein QFC22_006374 [Naganishia vaughanmartiniae]|uniref:Uncharacterized protein n=1 Tax=Naganishia vaughanmartiniae TaxID=1424756 RepID=A0ACC2WK09_9TREE|nr:hypothetical protein QFC22_006374 [Naganishia vaughanmartiniae]
MAQQLLTIPNISAYHLPSPTSEGIILAKGDLVISLLPAAPPEHPKPTLTLSVGGASFLIKEGTPVVKTDTNHEHASWLFAPALPDTHAQSAGDLGANGGELGTPAAAAATSVLAPSKLGKIKLVPAESHSPASYDRQESFAAEFEKILKEHKCWKEVGYYDLEDELALADPAGAGYGTTIADTLGYYGRVISNRLSGLTTTKSGTSPSSPAPAAAPVIPSETTKSTAAQANNVTHTISEYTHTAGEALGHAVHDGAAYLGHLAAGVVGSVEHAVGAAPAPGDRQAGRGEVVELQEPGGTSAVGDAARSLGQKGLETWEEVKLGVADGVERAGVMAQSVSESAHMGIEQRYGAEADKVAQDPSALIVPRTLCSTNDPRKKQTQTLTHFSRPYPRTDIGQTGANVGSVAMDGMLATSVIAHGVNAGDGVVEGYARGVNAAAGNK